VITGIPQDQFGQRHCEFVRAQGLALRAVSIAAHDESVNLLPAERREEVESSLIRPLVFRGLLVFAVAAMALGFFGGRYMVQNVTGVRVAQSELKVSREKIQNPYLNKLAQASQQKSRLETEIGSILKESLPLHILMRKIDSYNRNGLGMVSVNYSVDPVGMLVLRLQAKSDSRETTEKFIMELEKEPFFSNMISPLSNLVGKGERFINIDLNVNGDKVIAAYEAVLLEREAKINEKDEGGVKGPSIPTEPKISNGAPAPATGDAAESAIPTEPIPASNPAQP